MNIEAIVFDLDGVLLKSEDSWQEAISKTVQDFGGNWEKSDREMMDRHMRPKAWSTWIRDRVNLATTPEEVHQTTLKHLITDFQKDLPLIPGARETVIALSEKYPLALATGSDREVVDTFLDLSDLRKFFSFSLAAEDVSQPKPDPEIYQKATYLLNSRPERTLAIEDSTVGIESALSAGLTTICYLDEERPAENLDRVHLVLRQLGALPELLLWPRARA